MKCIPKSGSTQVVGVNRVNYPTSFPLRPFSHFSLVIDVDQCRLLICCNGKLSPKGLDGGKWCNEKDTRTAIICHFSTEAGLEINASV